MARSYGHIQQYEKEILALKEQGLTQKQIGERLGFTTKQVKDFFHRYNEKQRKVAAGVALRKKGRPRLHHPASVYCFTRFIYNLIQNELIFVEPVIVRKKNDIK